MKLWTGFPVGFRLGSRFLVMIPVLVVNYIVIGKKPIPILSAIYFFINKKPTARQWVFSRISHTLNKLYYFRLESYCLVLSSRFLVMKMQLIIALNIIVMSENHTD